MIDELIKKLISDEDKFELTRSNVEDLIAEFDKINNFIKDFAVFVKTNNDLLDIANVEEPEAKMIDILRRIEQNGETTVPNNPPGRKTKGRKKHSGDAPV